MQSVITLEVLGRLCHDAVNALKTVAGEEVLPNWDDLDQGWKESTFDSINFFLENPDAGDDALHVRWGNMKLAKGYIYGPVRNDDSSKGQLTHPLLVDFTQLPPVQRAKDGVIRGLVFSMRPYLVTE